MKYDILYSTIAPDNVLRISELLALIGTKKLIPYMGYPVLVLHKRLCNDVDFKGDINHLFSDSYDIVQAVALLLCEHYGGHLSDISYFDKSGNPITVRMLCNRQIQRLVGKKLRRSKTVSLEALPEYMEPRIEMTDTEKDFTKADKVIESLELDEIFTTALECRMSGMSYPEIGRIIGRSQSTVWEYCKIIRQRYTAVYGEI